RTAVVGDRGRARRGALAHAGPAAWTAPAPFAARGLAARQNARAGFRVAEQKFEFARVQPHALAGRAEIHLHKLVLEHDQHRSARRTIHAVLPGAAPNAAPDAILRPTAQPFKPRPQQVVEHWVGK